MTFTFDENLLSDLHKDAYGFRPSADYFKWWDSCNDIQKQAHWDSLIADINSSMERDEQNQKDAIAKFEDRVANLMHSGTNRERVIDWLMQADDVRGDVEYFEFLNDLPYGYLKSKEVV